MKHLTFRQITKLQKTYGVDAVQESINNGSCWKIEGSAGRFAMSFLKSGVCMLPVQPKFDYYGNRVPSRNELKQGTKGTFLNSVGFWNRVLNGEKNVIEWLEETFGCVENYQI